jgi:hypothetical protein
MQGCGHSSRTKVRRLSRPSGRTPVRQLRIPTTRNTSAIGGPGTLAWRRRNLGPGEERGFGVTAIVSETRARWGHLNWRRRRHDSIVCLRSLGRPLDRERPIISCQGPTCDASDASLDAPAIQHDARALASEVTLAGGNSKSSFSEIRTLVAGAVDRETEWRARNRCPL